MVAQKQNDCQVDRLIAELAALWGVSLTYRDATGRIRESPRGSVVEVLRVLSAGTGVGSRLETDRDERSCERPDGWLREALRVKRAQISERLLEPVLVAWEGLLRYECPEDGKATLVTEQGHEQRVDGRTQIPFGYHRLQVEHGGRTAEATVISAPKRCWQEDQGAAGWGVFVPTYALRSERDWGAGDLADLDGLVDVVSQAGGSAVATLPILASYLDRPFEPSPYSPVSRLFWNEFYLAIERIPEWSDCASARSVWESREVQERVTEWRAEPIVDYAGVMRIKRRALEELSRHFFKEPGGRRWNALEAFVRRNPEAIAYADFRARVETQGRDWRGWSMTEQSAARSARSAQELSEQGRYYLYCQWQMEEQLQTLSGLGSPNDDLPRQERPAPLFLDIPVGVHPGGFDVWRHRDLFVEGMSIGAPPDAFFDRGQLWDSPPLHPGKMRIQAHSHWSQILRHHMRFAGRVRIDHVMSLHRLFWIPEGREPAEGVYVDYPMDEMYAILCLESHRHRTMVTGEDLGTVPPGVRPRMRRHGVSSTWVMQSRVRPRAAQVIEPVPRDAVAALGTHDMFPFAGFLEGDDIRARLQMGRLDQSETHRALVARRRLIGRLSTFLAGETDTPESATTLRAALSYIADSEAGLALANVDDLLLQHEPHNVPGTGQGTEWGKTNWRRRLGCGDDQVKQAIIAVADTLTRRRSV